MWNLLSEVLPEGGRFVGLGEAAIYALIGFFVVFLGISFLILVVWLVGLAIGKFTNGAKKKAAAKVEPVVQAVQDNAMLDDETVAVITAAIAAYYQKQQIPCEFVIKKIKRN